MEAIVLLPLPDGPTIVVQVPGLRERLILERVLI